MPKNIPIDLIFYAYWTSDTNPSSYMNIVYELTLVSKIEVVFDFQT
jgi:hypothetical protein